MAFDPTIMAKGITGAIDNMAQRKAEQSAFMMKMVLQNQELQRQKQMAEFRNPKLAIWNRISEKEKRGLPLTSKESEFKDSYLGIDKKTKDIKAVDRKRVWDLAKEVATMEGQKGMDPMMGTKYSPTIEDIQKHLLDAQKFLYPNVEESAIDSSMEKVKVKTPGGQVGMIPKKNLSEALKRGAVLVE